jgi:8-oxo-dGTP pyrophosphatase MutT (NUDIX family)
VTFDTAALRQLLAARAPAEATEEASAAVASILRDGAEGAELLFIHRAEREGDPWSGHLAFPGGKRETIDGTLRDTAVRETLEEVGLELPRECLVTRLGDVRARIGGYRVAQYVFTLDVPDRALTANAEVASMTWRSIERLARKEGAGTLTYRSHGYSVELPCLRWDGHELWGMTYRMTMQLLEAAGIAT